MRKHNTNKKTFIGVGIIVFVILLGFIVYQKGYYGNRWYPKTTINGFDVSNMTFDESVAKLTKLYEEYELHIKGRQNRELIIVGKDIDYQFGISDEFSKTFSSQHELLPVFSKDHTYTLNYDVTYDDKKLKKIVKRSEMVRGSETKKITKPVAASVEYSSLYSRYVVRKEILGDKIVTDTFLNVIDTWLKEAVPEVDFSGDANEYGIYKEPKYNSESEEIQIALEACNNAALRYIIWDLGNDITEKITPKDMSGWISYKKGKIVYDNEAIEQWVENFCLKYKTMGMKRKFKSHTGKYIEVEGGDFGWQIDYDKTLRQAKNAIKKKLPLDVTNAFAEDPIEDNKKSITIEKEVQYLNKGFQMNLEHMQVDWDTNNYIEVCLKHQKVYVFRNGEVVFSCRTISGKPVEGRKTTTGTYYIKEHRRNYTLTGDDYKTLVKYWVRITWTGTGFHPATWQPWSKWTKDLYKTRGSHGCLNLEPGDAKKIYQLTSYREAVFMHY